MTSDARYGAFPSGGAIGETPGDYTPAEREERRQEVDAWRLPLQLQFHQVQAMEFLVDAGVVVDAIGP
jgi:hypothetical protein